MKGAGWLVTERIPESSKGVKFVSQSLLKGGNFTNLEDLRYTYLVKGHDSGFQVAIVVVVYSTYTYLADECLVILGHSCQLFESIMSVDIWNFFEPKLCMCRSHEGSVKSDSQNTCFSHFLGAYPFTTYQWSRVYHGLDRSTVIIPICIYIYRG